MAIKVWASDCDFQDSDQISSLQVICKQNLSKSGRDNLVTEIALLKKLKHKFIVDLIDFHWDEKYIYIGKLFGSSSIL